MTILVTSPSPRTATVVSVFCPMCTSGAIRTERGWVVAVNGAPQWTWGFGGGASLEECHGQAAV